MEFRKTDAESFENPFLSMPYWIIEKRVSGDTVCIDAETRRYVTRRKKTRYVTMRAVSR
ncbi:hypothetical protein [Burkholderia gladioli]|uniref:hypothetical protein n=1 Tax=Burkholderia gladioli TaxID=28095 RepID=UPI002650B1E6|nr:hypothetical protein [Burkholderia gladioli]MDN7720844.1 hypothetical protein [Burkholderia gladioli]